MGTALDNAAEFGRHERGGGWALGLLVACSVQPDVGHGKRNDRSVSKVSIAEFARRAGTSGPRVSRYLQAWDRAAAQRVVPAASTLQPGDVEAYDLPVGYEWGDYYDSGDLASTSGSIIDRLASRIDNRGADKVAGELPADTRRELLNALARKRDAVGSLTPENREHLRSGIAEAGYVAPDHTHTTDTVRRNLARSLEIDEAVSYLRQAVHALALAIRAKDEDGVTDRAGEQKALSDLHRLVQLYSASRSRWTDGDDEFLREAGIKR